MVPSLFLAHGSPMIAIENNDYTQFLKSMGQKIKPKAIVVFTAHFESDVLTISSSNDRYETIHDFGGFSDELYTIQYPAKGSSKVADQLEKRFKQQGIDVRKNMTRGLDHGVWTLLLHMYPEADIPVVQVSIHPYLPPNEQFKIGQALKGMGEEDILIIGSGGTVHNLFLVKWGQKTPEEWAVEFDDWLLDKMNKKDLSSLFNYDQLAPHARLAVPRAEHFVPLFIAMGSGDEQREVQVLHRSYDLGSLSYLCIQF